MDITYDFTKKKELTVKQIERIFLDKKSKFETIVPEGDKKGRLNLKCLYKDEDGTIKGDTYAVDIYLCDKCEFKEF